tara:strand:- start:690 stop:821 length:132 start_codon:yes stop_codon:yes gene_type:complete
MVLMANRRVKSTLQMGLWLSIAWTITVYAIGFYYGSKYGGLVF